MMRSPGTPLAIALSYSKRLTTSAQLPGVGTVPLNVAKLCSLTSMCTRQDIHPNAQGYGVIAQAFAAALR